MLVNLEYLKTSIAQLEGLVQELGSFFEKPTLVDIGDHKVFRHRVKNDLLMSYLKCVRAVSSLNAALVLLRNGYVQEVGTLCRCIQDFCDDVLFLATPLGEKEPSADQRRLVEEFYQEDFDQPANPLVSIQKRDRVPRPKIQAGIARIQGHPINPSDATTLHRTIQQVFSGYVHGAYVHTMEMYGGNPPKYHTSGMLHTPRVHEWERQLVNYIYRAVIAAEIVAKRVGATLSIENLRKFREAFETETKCTGIGNLEREMKKLKSPKPTTS
jgi:hypothetical protein